ncbi:MAG: hypothetical protein D6698_13900 [Gammaproteobacteria bacterium]|nr:MAG: hypothetical protein D6698_13900 [Gammaproteobacteria bacterium]
MDAHKALNASSVVPPSEDDKGEGGRRRIFKENGQVHGCPQCPELPSCRSPFICLMGRFGG